MKVLVTGCEGVLGQQLCHELIERGHTVVGMDITRANHIAFPVVRGDVANPADVERVFHAFAPLDAVYHLAAEVGRVSGEIHNGMLWSTNCGGTKNIIRECEERGVKLILFSSGEVYGDSQGWDAPVADEGMTERIYPLLKNDYAISKWVNEQQLRNSHVKEWCIIRPFNTYGPGEPYREHRSVVVRFIIHTLLRKPYYIYEGAERIMIHFKDFTPPVANVLDLPTFPHGEAFNIGGHEVITIEQLHLLVAAITGAPARRPEVTYQTDHLGTMTKPPSVEKAERVLGLKQTILMADGLDQTVRWLRSKYGL